MLSSLPHQASVSIKTVYSYTIFSLKLAASAVLKYTPAVIAIAHVRSVSIKPLSVTTMFSSSDSLSQNMTQKTPKRLVFRISPSVSSSPVSLANFSFFIIRFLVWVVVPPLPGLKHPSTFASIGQYRADR